MTCFSSRIPGLSRASLALAFLQAGCAGANHSSVVALKPDAIRADASAPRSSRPEAPAAAASPLTPSSLTGATCGLANFESDILTRINQYRAKGANCHSAGQFAAARPLVWNARLQQAASGHSQDMASRNYFSHTSLDGRSMFDRINATGYTWSAISENIAATAPTVNAAVDGWMASATHCENLMKPALQDVAMACVASITGNHQAYWTMDTGTPL